MELRLSYPNPSIGFHWVDNFFELVFLLRLFSVKWSKFDISTFKTEQKGCHVADNIYRCIFRSDFSRILIEILIIFFPKDQ